MRRLLRFATLLTLLAAPCFAGRNIDPTNENIDFGSDASVDNFDPRSICMWTRNDASGSNQCLFSKGPTTQETWLIVATINAPRHISDWTTDGNWIATTNVTGGTLHHLCMVYSHSATTNDPTFYVDGVVEVLSTDTAPTGSWVADAANNLQIGETNSGALDYDGVLGWFVYANTNIGADGVNRARWWGRPNGGMEVYHPFVTDKLTNEGSATADGTATGTSVVSLPRVERNTGTMLGVGR